MKTNNISEKLVTKRSGVSTTIRLKRDILPQKEQIDSWFFVGRAKSKGHDINFLYHLMNIKGPAGFKLLNGVFSVTDMTTGWYDAEDTIVLHKSRVKSKDGKLIIHAANGSCEGDLREFKVKAGTKKSAIDIRVIPAGDVIYNGGSGSYPLLDHNINYQFSIPNMEMYGTVTIEGKEFKIEKGMCWFDRQYNSTKEKMKVSKDTTMEGKWAWMGISLSNGESISLWEIIDKNNKSDSFATILHKDGTQTVAYMEPIAKTATEPWKSSVTGQNYPTKWLIVIPKLDIELTVTCIPKGQEICSKIKGLNKYEAQSLVNGTYEGEEVTGSSCVELLGEW